MIRAIVVLIAGLLLTLAASCVGMHGQSTLDAIQGSLNQAKPIVEAYIEYPGPQERWAGPGSVAIHVTARDGASPTISISPNVFQGEASGEVTVEGKKSGLTSQVVRERLALVATALTQNVASNDEKQGGCLSPVRARLIKSDGQVIEKRGCRSQTGWAFQASDAATDLIAAAENGSREPAAAAAATAVMVPPTAAVPAEPVGRPRAKKTRPWVPCHPSVVGTV